jgi:hypothetical protein
MKHSFTRWGSALLASLAIAGCGGGSSSDPVVPASLSATIAAASAQAANDSASNTSAPFTVLQSAGVPAVTIAGAPKVNFSVFSDGKVVTGLTAANFRFAIAKLVPGTNGEADQWVSYISNTVAGKTGFGPGGVPVLKSAPQASAETAVAAQLTYNPDGYYTYTMSRDVTKGGRNHV